MMKCIPTAIFATVSLAISLQAAAYEPPIGIPMPPFGIEETHYMYQGQSGYSDVGNGPYTHYVDNSGSCTNSGQGSPSSPLCKIPSSLNAGSVVEVHGGPYTTLDPVITATGSASQPVFIRGVDDGNGLPSIKNGNQLKVYGSFYVFENFDLNGTRLTMGFSDGEANNAVVRNSRIHDHPTKNGTNLYGDNLLFWNNEVDHNQGNDRHGTYVGSGSKGVWILDNYYHHNGGDAVQFCHGCSANPPDTVYIGRNLMHSDRENGVDLKYSKNIVISENTIHSYKKAPKNTHWCFDDGSGCGSFSSGSDGAAVVVGSDGAPTNVWVIFNKIYDSNTGIRIEEAGSSVTILGNLIYNLNSSGLALQKKGEPITLVANTFYNMSRGIDQYWRENFDMIVKDNIFLETGMAINYEDRDVAETSLLESNIIWEADGNVPIRWANNVTLSSSSDINQLSGQSKSGNMLENPRLANAAAGNFLPNSNSVAIDSASSAIMELDVTYRSLFAGATSIKMDMNGNPRSGNNIDIGALESSSGGDSQALAPPQAPVITSITSVQ